MEHQTLFQVVYYFAYNLTKAFTAFIQRDSFLYWPYLMSGVVIAIVVAVITARAQSTQEKVGWRAVARDYLSARVWWNRSARADYRLYVANALALPILFSIAMFGDGHIAGLLDSVLGRGSGGAGPTSGGAGVASRLAFTIVFFVAYDFGRFVAHSALHDVPVLWEFHKVHHSAESLNPMTAARVHPVDLLVMSWVPLVMTGTVTWVFNQFTATPITFYKYIGLHVILFAFNFLALLRHTPVWLSYGPRWSKWLISPAQHQLHHSYEPHHVGCNRGFELAIWDRLYGTLYVPRGRETFRMGLGDGTDGEWHNVRRMYWWPFVNAGKRLLGGRRHEPLPPMPPSA